MIYKIQPAQPLLIYKHKNIKDIHVIPGDIPEAGRDQNGAKTLEASADTASN